MAGSITYTAKKGLKLLGSEVGAWLADTTEETVVGAELVVNGDFATDTVWAKGTGWTIAAGVASNTGSSSELTSDANVGVMGGTTYVVTLEITAYTSGVVRFSNGLGVTIGANPNYTSIGTYSINITPSSDGVVSIFSSSFIGSIDNVSIRISDNDLSTNDHDLAYYGTITKAPVATGSTVMGYSGFSASNYLEHSYDSALDFGTGDFSYHIWHNNSSSTDTLFQRGATVNSDELVMYISSAQDLFFRVKSSGNQISYASAMTVSEIALLSFIKRSGVIEIWKNGVLLVSGSNTESATQPEPLYIGRWITNGSNSNGGAVSLAMVYHVALTATQIKAIYDSEKHMFKANSIFTQVGESYSIDLRLDKVGRSENVESSAVKSLGGNQETVYQRTDVMYGINCKNVPKASLPEYRVWLQSVSAGETFTFDPYGTIASPDDPISVIADGGHRESRVDNLDYFNISQKLREV